LANPKHVVTKFRSTTGLTNIRNHFVNHHIADWVAACEKFGATIHGVKAQREVRKYKDLPEPTDLESNRPEFSREAFVNALAEFVVGDDQV
jgi:hypothetical protein